VSTIDLGRGWTETTEHAASSYGLPVYVRGGQSHSLEEALAAGMLREVRQARVAPIAVLANRRGNRTGRQIFPKKSAWHNHWAGIEL